MSICNDCDWFRRDSVSLEPYCDLGHINVNCSNCPDFDRADWSDFGLDGPPFSMHDAVKVESEQREGFFEDVEIPF